MQLNCGGWSREVTVRELPVATTLAAVNMSLTPGGVRELHWHQQAEWSYMLIGSARITSVDQNGRNFIADIGPGDLWYFPPGIPHSIQGLAEGCEFLLVFDDGSFSDLNTLSISDWFAHTPKEVPWRISAYLLPPLTAYRTIRSTSIRMKCLTIQSQKVQSPYGDIPLSFKHQLLAQPPLKTPGGSVRIVDSSNFPVSRTIAAALVEIEPGAMRELHWHPNNDEWQYYLAGHGRMTVFGEAAQPVPSIIEPETSVMSLCLWTLYPEYRHRHALVSGNVQKRPLRRRLPEPVDGPDSPSAGGQ